MTWGRSTEQTVAHVMGEPSPPNTGAGRIAFTRLEAVTLCTCASALFEHKMLLLALHIKRLLALSTILWLPSVILLDIFALGIVAFFLLGPKFWHLRTSVIMFMSRIFAIIFSAF